RRAPARAPHARGGRGARARPRRPRAARHDGRARRRGPVAAAARRGERRTVPGVLATTRPGGRGGRAGARRRRRGRGRDPAPAAAAAVLVPLALSFAPPSLVGHVTVFTLAVIVGYYVISNVTHSLHTPLMAQTNAISGIILVGALLQIGSDDWVVTTLAVLAATVASINIFGGFLVANRMIRMFRKDAPARGVAR